MVSSSVFVGVLTFQPGILGRQAGLTRPFQRPTRHKYYVCNPALALTLLDILHRNRSRTATGAHGVLLSNTAFRIGGLYGVRRYYHVTNRNGVAAVETVE